MYAAIYTRVSTVMQAEEGFSLEAQQDILMQTIERKGLTLFRTYSDPGVSGKTFKRPGVQALINDMKAGRFEALLIHKLDRLSRSMGDIISFIELANKLNIRLIIAAQGQDEIDTRSPLGKAFLQFNGIWAELYLNNLREETLKGLVKKAKKGGRHISRPPLGYEFDSEMNMVIVEDEAILIREVFDLFTDKCWGVTKIAKHMNEHSVTKEGGKWDNKTVRNIITNPTYAGLNHFKPDNWKEDQRIIENGKHESIVELEQFEKSKSFRKRRSEGTMSRRSFVYPYSGIIRCGQCGATYTGNSSVHKGKKYLSYRCLNQYAKGICDAQSISEARLNSLVFNYIDIIDDGYPNHKNNKLKEVNLQKEIEISNRRCKNWMMALGDGNLSGEDYSNLIAEENARMNEIQSKVSVISEPTISPLELRKTIATLKEKWDKIEPDDQKQIMQSLFKKITIQRTDEWRIIDLITV